MIHIRTALFFAVIPAGALFSQPTRRQFGGELSPLHRVLGPSAAAASSATPDASSLRWSSPFNFTPDTALVGHSATYDSTNKVMTLFGGVDQAGSLYNDVWVLSFANGISGTATWIPLTPSGTGPSRRYSHTAVYDASANRLVVYGGYDGTDRFDAWVLTHANGNGGTPAWIQLSPAGAPPNGSIYDAAVYDPNHDIMMVFGGEMSGSTGYSNQVTALTHASGLNGPPVWTVVVAEGAAGSPSQRAVATANYDVTNNRMIVFGGAESTGIRSALGLNGTWVLANANGVGGAPAWTKLSPQGALPGSRFGHTANYDASTNQLIVFAGENPEAFYFTSWVLTHANGL